MTRAVVYIDLSGLEEKFNKVGAAFSEAVKLGTERALVGAQLAVEKRIETSGTYGSAKRFSGEYEPFAGPGISGEGRVDSGRMLESVETSIDEQGGIVVGTVQFPKNSPKYFKLQEEGFDYITNSFPISGAPHHVEGMFAFKDAETLLRKTAPGLVGISIRQHLKRTGK